MLNSEQHNAYQLTDYWVWLDRPLLNSTPRFTGSVLCFQIGQADVAWQRFAREHTIQQAAIITADNPMSKRCSPEENKQAQQQLTHYLEQQQAWAYASQHVAQRGDWPDEIGWMILGISLEEATALAKRLGQAAIVWLNRETITLHWCIESSKN
ncbi:DUF3293 domain-containing protein [Parvibium lacunae]|uniref:DUF3293 domain-containing protein n=1 Tax=Parvibium lacunae TaxID=1888893 RepID=A0A368L7L8_9BURK|nr:DUF3293 domain-containing protein [Parvibium lacunae]RCS59552.1 DUF3293 domain-containing protein [Parvibium lacunae]